MRRAGRLSSAADAILAMKETVLEKLLPALPAPEEVKAVYRELVTGARKFTEITWPRRAPAACLRLPISILVDEIYLGAPYLTAQDRRCYLASSSGRYRLPKEQIN